MKPISLAIIFFCLFFISACVKDKTKNAIDEGGYPANIAAIMVSKCATAGCHNTASKNGAAGLDFSTWEKAMQGGNGGASIIPFYHKQSTVFLFCNTYDDLGAKVAPSMPYNASPLSRDEVVTLREWIDNGAPNKDGFVKFSDNPLRHKVYITNQSCQLVAVIDADSKLVMRYVEVGTTGQAGSTHRVMVSPDGSFWCVCSLGGNVVKKYSAVDENFLGQVTIGAGNWNTMTISKDGTIVYVVDQANGKVAAVDLVNYTLISGAPAEGFNTPHGSALSADEKFLYVTGQTGNFIYKIDTATFFSDMQQISVDGNPPVASSSLDIHDILFSPDKSKYFLTCQKSNEVRVMNAANDSLLAVIPVGTFPQEMAFSTSTSYLFVTCMEDVTTFAPNRGSVYVIDYNNFSVVKSLNTGWQPHGVAVDDANKVAYVANRNATVGGPAPHHTTDCGGRNGYLTLIDLNTLNLVTGFKTELSADPYSCAYR